MSLPAQSDETLSVSLESASLTSALKKSPQTDSAPTAKAAGAAEPETNRQTAGKVRVDLVPLELVEGLAEVFEMGANKYAPWAWQKNAMPRWVMYASALRHVIKSRREKLDDESGLDHRLHAAWNLLIDWYYDEHGYKREETVDDRPKHD